MLTVVEAAQRVGRSMSTVRRWIRSGFLPATMAGGRWLIEPDALDDHPVGNDEATIRIVSAWRAES
ncbi:MAG TPA: helix-turn-helix domain-containing protein [Solirubrobacteraceae bacterium]|nr:helix-turn-helix domain-containing protein [Solirubrobacteraceae bacterium]